jgi:hypothetical protein
MTTHEMCHVILTATVRTLSDVVMAHGGNLPVALYWHPTIATGLKRMDEEIRKGQPERYEKGKACLIAQAQQLLATPPYQALAGTQATYTPVENLDPAQEVWRATAEQRLSMALGRPITVELVDKSAPSGRGAA